MANTKDHTYTVYYYPGRGEAEPIYLLFHFLKIKFIDQRVQKDNYDEVIKKSPLRQLPLLEIDRGNVHVSQATTICRFLAKTLPSNRWSAGFDSLHWAHVDMVVEGFAEIYRLVIQIATAPEDIQAKLQTIHQDTISWRLEVMQDALQKRPGHYFSGNRIHWCDIYALAVLQTLDEFQDGIFHMLPSIRAFYLRMRQVPEIRGYIDSNWPPTKYKNQ